MKYAFTQTKESAVSSPFYISLGNVYLKTFLNCTGYTEPNEINNVNGECYTVWKEIVINYC